MKLRERLKSIYEKLETVSRRYLLPQEFYAVLLFFGIGVLALCYRGGKSLFATLFSSDPGVVTFVDSSFIKHSQYVDSLNFWQPTAPMQVPAARKREQTADDLAIASIVLNRASSRDLEKLPGVGEVMSKRIIEYRTSRGKFKSLEELMNVSGIGPKKFEKMKQYLRLE